MSTFRVSVPDLTVGLRVQSDDPLVRAAVAPLLREAGARVEAVEAEESSVDLVAGPAVDLAPDVPSVVLVADDEEARAAWRAGAAGLLPRSVDGEALLAALLAAARGLTVIDPDLAAALGLPLRAPLHDALAEAEPLTEREREVLALLAEGLPNKLIADRLGVAERTARYHVAQILAKLDVQSRTEAVVRAARLGLVVL